MSESKVLVKKELSKDDVPSMLQIVTEQIQEIKGNLPKEPKTTKELPGFGKISSINTVEQLIKAASSVIAKKEAYDEAAKEIVPEAIKVPTFTINGVSAPAWLDDIRARVVVVGHKTQLEKLEKVKRKLEENLSAEAKLARDLAEIQTILKPE